jgi:CTD kinase subunit beta
MTLLII